MAAASGHRHGGKAGPQPGAQKTPTLLAQRPEVQGHGSAALVLLGGSEGQPVPWCHPSVRRLPAALDPQTFSASRHIVGRVSKLPSQKDTSRWTGTHPSPGGPPERAQLHHTAQVHLHHQTTR